jgi:tRNA pseudouridine38-40 synthase
MPLTSRLLRNPQSAIRNPQSRDSGLRTTHHFMRNVRLTLAYDGTDFHGWQIQPGFRTVQQTVEEAVAALTGEGRRVNASGRTDTGVHAVGQVVNFATEATYPPEVFVRALNAHLPADVQVRDAAEVPLSFDANRDARGKRYRYVIHDGPLTDLFLGRFCHHSRRRLDHQAMARAARVLLGQHDFRCFETDWPNRASSVRTITHLSLHRLRHFIPMTDLYDLSSPDEAGDWIWLDVEADGFLYNMVRAIAGTLLEVGRGFWPESQVASILQARDRTLAGPTAPAQGLFLMRVLYDD